MTVKELRDILNELIEYEYGDCEIGMRRNGYHSIDFYALETHDDGVTRIGLSEGFDPEEENYPQE